MDLKTLTLKMSKHKSVALRRSRESCGFRKSAEESLYVRRRRKHYDDSQSRAPFCSTMKELYILLSVAHMSGISC